MSRVRLAVAMGAAVAVFAACAAIVISAYGASPARRNDAATRIYLRARASFLGLAAANVVDHDARLRRLVREVSAGCPSVVTASPLEPKIVERRQAGGADRVAVGPSNRELFAPQGRA